MVSGVEKHYETTIFRDAIVKIFVAARKNFLCPKNITENLYFVCIFARAHHMSDCVRNVDFAYRAVVVQQLRHETLSCLPAYCLLIKACVQLKFSAHVKQFAGNKFQVKIPSRHSHSSRVKNLTVCHKSRKALLKLSTKCSPSTRRWSIFFSPALVFPVSIDPNKNW